METSQLIKNLEAPKERVDMVLDTDAYNEIDDQFAIAYALLSPEKINLKAIYAAPFSNNKSTGPADGMEKSYQEILKLLDFAGREDMKEVTYRGATEYMPDEKTPVMSDAVNDLINRARTYTAENPLYVVAIGAITNVSSAIVAAPDIVDKIVIVWLGGAAWHMQSAREFNMMQDYAGARVIFGCGAPVVQLSCNGVVSEFRISKPELEYWLMDKNPLADYLARNTIAEADSYAAGKPWTRVIWDVTAVAWVVDGARFMNSTLEHSPVPEYDEYYSHQPSRHFMRYVYHINRDKLMEDLIGKLTK